MTLPQDYSYIKALLTYIDVDGGGWISESEIERVAKAIEAEVVKGRLDEQNRTKIDQGEIIVKVHDNPLYPANMVQADRIKALEQHLKRKEGQS